MENFENIKNKIVRDNNGNIISANNFSAGDYIVFEKKLGAYSDAQFIIVSFFEQDYMGHKRSYVKYDSGISPVDDFFSKGYRRATQLEISKYIRSYIWP